MLNKVFFFSFIHNKKCSKVSFTGRFKVKLKYFKLSPICLYISCVNESSSKRSSDWPGKTVSANCHGCNIILWGNSGLYKFFAARRLRILFQVSESLVERVQRWYAGEQSRAKKHKSGLGGGAALKNLARGKLLQLLLIFTVQIW